MQWEECNEECRKGLARRSAALGLAALGTAAAADTFTLRIGSGHPNGPAVYVADTANFFVPEVKRRVAEETEHEIEFVEGYGGAIAGVAETLEAVQNGILDIGAYCICFEPRSCSCTTSPTTRPSVPRIRTRRWTRCAPPMTRFRG